MSLQSFALLTVLLKLAKCFNTTFMSFWQNNNLIFFTGVNSQHTALMHTIETTETVATNCGHVRHQSRPRRKSDGSASPWADTRSGNRQYTAVISFNAYRCFNTTSILLPDLALNITCIAGIAPQPVRQPSPRLQVTGRIRSTGGLIRAWFLAVVY